MAEKQVLRADSSRRTPRAASALVVLAALAALMAVIDGTIVTTSLRGIATDLGADLETAAWFTAAYLVAAGVTMPLSGWIIEAITPRRALIISLVAFVVGSVLCSMAWNAESLIIFRVLQGLGGGLLEPTALTIAAMTAGPARMGRVMGAVSGVINVAPVIGPLLGAALTGAGHWQAIFLINVPLGAIVLVGALVLMGGTNAAGTGEDASGDAATDTPGGVERPDVVGLALLPVGFVALLLGVEEIGRSAWSAAGVGIGAVLLAAYSVRTLRSDRPAALDLRLLRIRGFRAGLTVMAAVGFTMYFQLVALALLAHERWGWTGVAAGALVAALGAGLLISMTAAGRLSDTIGARVIVTRASLATAALAAVVSMVAGQAPVAVVVVLAVALGLSFGAVAAPAFSSVYSSVPPDRVPYATPSLFVTVQLCAAVGAGVAGILTARISASTAVVVGYLIITAALLAASAAARGLPGRPAS